jgi:hypothetical protein
VIEVREMRVGCLLKSECNIEDFANAINKCKSRAYKQNIVYIDNNNKYFVVKRHNNRAYKYYIDEEALNELHKQKLLIRKYKFEITDTMKKKSKTYTIFAENTIEALKRAFSTHFNTKLVRVTKIECIDDSIIKKFDIVGEIVIDRERDNNFIVFHDYEVRKLAELYNVIAVYKFFAEYKLHTLTREAWARGKVVDTYYYFEIEKLSPL